MHDQTERREFFSPPVLERASWLIFLLAVSLFQSWCFRHPEYNWDMIAYMAQARLFHETNIRAVHAETYVDLQAQVPPAEFDKLTTGAYRADMKANYLHFVEQLPGYSIKPLYVILVQAFHLLGAPYVKAALLPSALSYFFLAILLFVWLGRYLSGFYRILSSLLILFSHPVSAMARLSTPDSLSAALVFAALFFLLECDSLFLCSAFLAVSMYARTNNIILVVPLFSYFALWGKDRLRLPFPIFGGLIGLFGAVVIVVHRFSGFYGWSMLIQSITFGPVIAPGETIVHISARTYLELLKAAVTSTVFRSMFPVAFLLGGLALFVTTSARGGSLTRHYRPVILVVLLTMLVSMLLLPSIAIWLVEERLLVAHIVFLAVSAIVSVAAKLGSLAAGGDQSYSARH